MGDYSTGRYRVCDCAERTDGEIKVGIVIAATITVATGFWIFCKLARGLHADRAVWVTCWMAGLPMSALVNLLVKRPVYSSLLAAFRIPADVVSWPSWFALFGLLVGGVIEEAIKILALLLPRLREQSHRRQGAASICLAIDFSFGIGEAL